MRKLHLTHIAFIFSTALSVALISCQDLSEFDTQQIDQVLQADKIGSSESWGFRLNLMDEGRKVLDLEASYAKFVENNEESFTEISGPIFITIYDEATGELQSTITCDSALYRSSVGVFEMYYNVEINTTEEKILRSDYLKWQRFQDRMSTPLFVTFIAPPDSISALGFEGNTDLSEYTLNEGGGTVVID